MKKNYPKYIDLKGLLSFRIVNELSKDKLCGDDLAKIIGERKGSKLTPGTIYPALKRLRKLKLIKHTKKGRKKTYFLTKNGIKEQKIAKLALKKLLKKIF